MFRPLRGLGRQVGCEPQARLRLTWGYHSVRQLRWLGESFNASSRKTGG